MENNTIFLISVVAIMAVAVATSPRLRKDFLEALAGMKSAILNRR